MTRPLKILKGIVEQDPAVIRDKISKLLGETTAISEEALKHLSICLRLLLNKDRANAADQGIVDLGVRFWNDIRAATILINEGFILPAAMMQRDAIETRVVAEYLYKYPKDAEAWQKAKTRKERRRFGINELKDKVEDGKGWKDIWDWLSSYIHPNRTATPSYSRSRPFFGYNPYLGSFYDPVPIATFFVMQLAICLNFVDSVVEWYKDDLPFPTELPGKIKELEESYRDQTNKLRKSAASEHQKIDKEIKTSRLSEDEIVKLLKFLDTLP